MSELLQILGQVLGFVPLVTGPLAYQMKTPSRLLAIQILTALSFSTHYFLIGATTAAALNIIGAVKCVCYYFRNRRGSKSQLFPIFFTVLVFVTGVLTWNGWYSIFIMSGLLLYSVSLSLSDTQTIRKLTLIKSPLCLVYNIFVSSGGGIAFEIVTLLSVLIGLFRHREKGASSTEEKPSKN